MYSFKDFMVVSYTQSGDELIDYQAYKRKRDMDSGEITASNDPEVDEAMTMQQRQKAKQTFRKNKAKILRGREKAKKKMASNEKLKGRARKQARNLQSISKPFLVQPIQRSGYPSCPRAKCQN